MPNITLREPGQDAAPSWTKRVNYYQFVGERLSADGDSRRGILPMSASAMAEALLTGHQIQWCTNLKSVLVALEKTLGAPVEISRTCGFHAIRPPSPLSSGQAFHGHLATCSTAIRPGSRSAATQGLHC